jgi:ATP-dependent HslUV protease ATP-binding subunit HslU
MQKKLKLISLTPREIVSELDRYIIGQDDAKKAVAIALRNRWRRQNVPLELQEEIVPKNILMVGPTGIGKTEISRRLAKLANAPFIKVEATKFTEIGYVGRDVESIIRDLLDNAMLMVRERYRKEVILSAEIRAEERLIYALVGEHASEETKEKFKKLLRENELHDKEIEVEILDHPSPMSSFDIPGMPGSQLGMINMGEMIGKVLGGERKKTKKMTVSEAREVIIKEESDKLIDEDKIIKEAMALVQDYGIVFIDEIDKISASSDTRGGQVSREGVQRDLLPLIEGTVVSTKYGPVKTDHVLFIASGAFHVSKPSDLLPELQGRLPIRVELKALTKDDMVRILTEPEASLIKQYQALIATENVKLSFTDEAIDLIAAFATEINRDIENIGARRLHTILEKLLADISYSASDKPATTEIIIDAEYVRMHISDLTRQTDLYKFIL